MATTSTTTATEPSRGTMPTLRNPRDSMKSTWRSSKDKKEWGFAHWVMEILGMGPTDMARDVPKHQKTDKMPYLPHLTGHKWILAHALWPLAINQAYIMYFGKNMHPIAAIVFYLVVFKFNAIHELTKMRNLGHTYGYLDGDKHERDQVPDARVKDVLHSLSMTASVRPMVSVFLAYRATVSPLATLSWWLPLEIGLYQIVLDFYFYWYHRIMHENDSLWRFHRTHHLTKHPTPLLSLYADSVQEAFDIIGIPIITYFTLRAVGLPMGFSDWWICQQYVVWTELWGHSGLRMCVTPPTTATPLLKLFDAELLTEDHDLHHRQGWKHSYNYGKQTRLWDKIFGTCKERIETVNGVIDWNQPAKLDVFSWN